MPFAIPPAPPPESLGPWLHREEYMRRLALSPRPEHIQLGSDGAIVLVVEDAELVYHAPEAVR